MSWPDEPQPITNSDDVIDSRDVIARIEYLQDLQESVAEMSEEETAELAALLVLQDEAALRAPDWRYGETLIRDSYFEDYARQLAEDIGSVPRNGEWPTSYIDWARAAKALQQDYSAVDFDGVTFWVRH